MHKSALRRLLFGAVLAVVLCGAARAQLLPPVQPPPVVGGTLGNVGRIGNEAIGNAAGSLQGIAASPARLAEARLDRLDTLVRANRERLEMTPLGPAVRGEVIAIDPEAATLAAARQAGFVQLRDETIEGIGVRAVTLSLPRGWSIQRALSRLQQIAPAGSFAANHLHGQSGAVPDAAAGVLALAQVRPGSRPVATVGIIDGGVAAHPSLRGSVAQQGFAAGAPAPSAHGTAIASLLAGEGAVEGAAPGAALVVADIYGRDPAGGNALALARALGWMAGRRVPVVAISLVGPVNPLVARAVASAQARGVRIVAAVGNDGRAAPPAYPASYPGVIAVTGVDRRNRVLIEAGRALHLDYAAPGADIGAASSDGRVAAVRGTSFAVPLVAGRLAAHVRSADPIAALDAEATERGRRDFGRGLVCGACRAAPRR
ncbi:MAG TPA: S8 family serine peptidase [Allosphingosinicella sp.]